MAIDRPKAWIKSKSGSSTDYFLQTGSSRRAHPPPSGCRRIGPIASPAPKSPSGLPSRFNFSRTSYVLENSRGRVRKKKQSELCGKPETDLAKCLKPFYAILNKYLNK